MNECRYCKCDFDHEPIEEEYCSQGCYENACERQYERSLEAYYGGDVPATMREQQIKAHEGKYGINGSNR